MTGKLAVYAAEEDAGIGYGTAPDLSLIDARRWVNRARQRTRVERIAGGPVPWVEVIPGRAGNRATANLNAWRIIAPSGHRHPAILTHELAHLITDQRYGREVKPHGPEWRAVYLALLSHLVSKRSATALRRAFRERGLLVAVLTLDTEDAA